MQSTSHKIIALLVLVSFLMIVVFSFAFMAHDMDEDISSDCPFSVMGVSLCSQGTVAVVIHHISSYHSFLNVPADFGVMTLLISLLLLASAILVTFVSSLLLEPPAFAVIPYDFPPGTSYNRKITRWLSLFENSPSLL